MFLWLCIYSHVLAWASSSFDFCKLVLLLDPRVFRIVIPTDQSTIQEDMKDI